MKLKLVRTFKGSSYTVGKLYINDEYFCDTLEDVVRTLPKTCPNTPKGKDCECSEKVKAKTAIPAGTYKVILSMSTRFKKVLPEILNVPHFRGIRIHSGNTHEDTEGCILVGTNNVTGKVTDSRNTFEKLMKELNKEKNNLSIEIL